MSDPRHPTNKTWVLFDPLVEEPPNTGEILLCINEGGVLIQSQWRDGYLAWGYKPTIPQSVKDRVSPVRSK